MIGPSTPGLAVPGRMKIGFLPDAALMPGPLGVMSKSGTLSYEVCYRLAQRGVGQSLWIGSGGDPVKGARFADLVPLFQSHAETEGRAGDRRDRRHRGRGTGRGADPRALLQAGVRAARRHHRARRRHHGSRRRDDPRQRAAPPPRKSRRSARPACACMRPCTISSRMPRGCWRQSRRSRSLRIENTGNADDRTLPLQADRRTKADRRNRARAHARRVQGRAASPT